MKDNPQWSFDSSTPAPVGNHLPYINASFLLKDLFYMIDQKLGQEGYVNQNFAGLSYAFTTAKLLNYLGYGYCPDSWVDKCRKTDSVTSSDPLRPYLKDTPLSLLPLAAYQKIYFDFYRFQRWERNYPPAYNFDYLNTDDCILIPPQYKDLDSSDFYTNGLFVLRYANFPKDLFFGMLPSPQYGETAAVYNTDGVASIRPNDLTVPLTATTVGTELHNSNGVDISATGGQFNILQLRQAQALQRYREIVGTGNQDYKTQVEKLYGVKLPQIANHTCTYLGGFSNSVNIQEVVNSNLASPDAAKPYGATLQGKGIGVDNNNQPINFDVQEHGIIMCIYHVVPLLDYELNAFHFDVTKTEADDFANPVFDKLGYQELPSYYLDSRISKDGVNSLNSGYFTLGYVPRYFDYKTSVDNIQGAFRSSLPNWLAPYDSNYLQRWFQSNGSGVQKYFFKVHPQIANPIFYGHVGDSVDSDQFLINSDLQVKAVRNLDFQGLPY